jgi:phosphatidylglycerol---prolipoprotein diacylglyceryl transferase
VFTSVVVGLLAVAYLVAQRGRPREVITRGAEAGHRGAGRRSSPADGSAAPVAGGAAGGPVERPAERTADDAVGTAPDAAGARQTTPPDEGERPAPR